MALTDLNKDRKIRRKTTADINPLFYGKLQPQAKELEEAILGAIMLEKSAFDTVIEILKPECFYVDAHQKIFRAMQDLTGRGMPIDLLTVVEQLKVNEELEAIGGPYYVSRLTNSVVSSANLESHSRIVLQKFIQRELIRISGEVIGIAYEESTDAFDLMDEAESKLFEITNKHLRKNFDDINTVLVETLKKIEYLRTRDDDFTGVPTGFPVLDKLTFGWQPTDLIILAARPSVGKTAFALNLARNAALHPVKPVPVAFFSLEMSASQLVQRILSAQSEISLDKISRGKMEDYEMKQLYDRGVNPLSSAPIFIDDTAGLNIFELRAKCRRLKNLHQVGLIIIDYLQLMTGTSDNRNGNREQEISKISRDLKGLAKELNVPIIALSQLSREVEKRKEGSKIPQLSDLRESGAIEQDADMVMFLFRPDYYEVDHDEHGDSIKGETHVKIAKHRNGSLDTVKLRAVLSIQKFVELENQESDGGLPPGRSKFRPVSQSGDTDSPHFYIQKGSRMNDDGFDNSGSPF
jgi:replicative DNA helicase